MKLSRDGPTITKVFSLAQHNQGADQARRVRYQADKNGFNQAKHSFPFGCENELCGPNKQVSCQAF